MQVYVNNKIYEIESTASLSQFIESLNWMEKHFAIAVNKIFIPRDQYDQYRLCEQDCIDIVSPMQGG